MRAAQQLAEVIMRASNSTGRRAWNTCCILALCITPLSTAHAEPGDAAAVAQARKDYADAMKGHDIGLQNAMRAQLAAQLAKSRERERDKRKRASRPPNTRTATG